MIISRPSQGHPNSDPPPDGSLDVGSMMECPHAEPTLEWQEDKVNVCRARTHTAGAQIGQQRGLPGGGPQFLGAGLGLFCVLGPQQSI